MQDVLTDVGAPDRIYHKKVSQTVSIQYQQHRSSPLHNKSNATGINNINNNNNNNTNHFDASNETSPIVDSQRIMSSVISNAAQSITLQDNFNLSASNLNTNQNPLNHDSPLLNDLNHNNANNIELKRNDSDANNTVANTINSCNNDYFFNYIDLGLDILFDGKNHSVKKFILHCNQIGHFDFNRWNKCNFYIIPTNNYCNGCIDSNSKWKDIVRILGHPKGDPLMYRSKHSRLCYSNNCEFEEKRKETSPNTVDNNYYYKRQRQRQEQKRERSIKIFAYQSCLFEITQNDCIATVTLFKETEYRTNNPLYSLKNANASNPFGTMRGQLSAAMVESQLQFVKPPNQQENGRYNRDTNIDRNGNSNDNNTIINNNNSDIGNGQNDDNKMNRSKLDESTNNSIKNIDMERNETDTNETNRNETILRSERRKRDSKDRKLRRKMEKQLQRLDRNEDERDNSNNNDNNAVEVLAVSPFVNNDGNDKRKSQNRMNTKSNDKVGSGNFDDIAM